MSYINRYLQPGETIVHRARMHWIIYTRAIVWTIVAAGVYRGSMRFADPDVAMALKIAAAAILLIAILEWLRAMIRRWSTELAITDRRIIVKRGLIRRSSNEMNLSKVESVEVEQSILGRILDFGTIIIKGTGGGLEPVIGIDRPLEFRSYVTAG
jgi:uncharacterized membrane protein YdbT with pleckstrin-like domain